MVEAKKQSESNVTPIEKSTVQPSEGASKGFHPIEEVNRMFDQFLHRSWMRPSNWEWPDMSHIPAPFGGKMPRMDVIDRDGEILIRAELPGVKKEDLEVSMTNNTVVIKGSSRHEEIEEKGDYYRSEIAHGTFQRRMVLPAEVDMDKAKSVFKDGLLELTVPKLVKTTRTISIE